MVLGGHTAQTADDAVLLGSNNSLALIGIGQCSLGIKGFDGVEVDNSGADALGLQRIRCLQSFRDHQSGGKDRHIRAILHHVGLAGDKGGVLLGVHIGHRTSATRSTQDP